MVLSRLFSSLFCALIFVAQFAVAAEGDVARVLTKEKNGRWNHCSVYCPGLDVLLIFGGYPSLPGKDDDRPALAARTVPEVFEFETETWMQVVSAGNTKPTPKMSCTLQLLESSSTGCSVVLVQSNLESANLETRVAKLSSPEQGSYKLTWLDNQESFIRPPSGRVEFCATGHNGKTYLHGGSASIENEAIYNSDLWELSILTNSTTGEVIQQWKSLNSQNDSNWPPPVSSCAMSVVDTLFAKNRLVLYGGRIFGSQLGTDYAFANIMRYFDLDAQRWSEGIAASKSISVFGRNYQSLVSYEGNVYGYGGFLQMQQGFSFVNVFPNALLSMTPSGNNPQASCSDEIPSQDSESALWCMYDNGSKGKLPKAGAAGLSCVLRMSQMVCTFGVNTDKSLFSETFRRMVIFELDIVKENLVVGYESFSAIESLLGSIYFFFAVVSMVTFVFCVSGVRNRRAFSEMMNGQFPVRVNRGARASVVQKIPIVEWQGQGLPVVPVAQSTIGGDDQSSEDQQPTPGSESGVRETSRLNAGEVNSNNVQSIEANAGGEDLDVEQQGFEMREMDPAQSSSNTAAGEANDVALPTATLTPDSNNSSDEDDFREMCSICLMEFEVGDHLRQLPCKHLFHPECIGQWLPTDKSCPLCKQDIDKLPGSRTASMESINPSYSEENVEDLEEGHQLQPTPVEPTWRNRLNRIRTTFTRSRATAPATTSERTELASAPV